MIKGCMMLFVNLLTWKKTLVSSSIRGRAKPMSSFGETNRASTIKAANAPVDITRYLFRLTDRSQCNRLVIRCYWNHAIFIISRSWVGSCTIMDSNMICMECSKEKQTKTSQTSDVRRQIITKSFGNISFSEKEEP